mmetsp:Transcript_65296/g.128184  ORF Transcript_65296/g.128184 Transcript_65296/m.128184 type:complete len:342 (+) Transcript_65296:71-1096(+)
MAPRVALFGAGGSLGNQVLPLLRASGCSTRVLIRGSAQRLDTSVRDCVDTVIVGDARNADDVEECCDGADVVVSMLTPRPTDPNFISLHVECTAAVIAAAKATGVKRLLVIGGAGVMDRSNSQSIDGVLGNEGNHSSEGRRPSFVTETLPGYLVKKALPIYGDFFEAHKQTLHLLREETAVSTLSDANLYDPERSSCSKVHSGIIPNDGIAWSMLCPGFLREGPPSKADFLGVGESKKQGTSLPSGVAKDDTVGHVNYGGGVRLWVDVNDERLGGLSATYSDLAALVVAETLQPRFSAVGRAGKRIGIESSGSTGRLMGYYPSLVLPTLTVCRWQLERWRA